MAEISFNYIKSLFDDNFWDVGVISGEQLHIASLHPLKIKFHYLKNIHSENYSNDIFFRKETNAIVLVCSGLAWDYTFYQQALDILDKNEIYHKSPYYMIYTNYKEAAILAGLGVRAKNSLIYSYKFGFDCHITCIRFEDEIIDLPTDKRVNYKIWNRCVGCDDCANACPVGAIHNKSKNPFEWWIDSTECDTFISLGEHPEIPSIKYYWHENVHPEVSIENITTKSQAAVPYSEGGLRGMPWDQNGYSFDGQVVRKNGKEVYIPVCRECTSQPRCSKWKGKFPYDQFHEKHIDIIEMSKEKP
ncbi:hypothetical protein EB001_27070 [bacterium]|nr:hypothetical protein [bacterium]